MVFMCIGFWFEEKREQHGREGRERLGLRWVMESERMRERLACGGGLCWWWALLPIIGTQHHHLSYLAMISTVPPQLYHGLRPPCLYHISWSSLQRRCLHVNLRERKAEFSGLKKREQKEREKRKREKDNEIMREEREEPNIEKQYFVIPLCYSAILPLGRYCSTMAKKFAFLHVSTFGCWATLGLTF